MLSQRMRHRIEIQEPVETRDSDSGAVVTTWDTVQLDSDTPLDAVPAEVLTGPGRGEFMAADTRQAETDARINFWWFPGLRYDMRILWDGRVYDIIGIETDRTGRMEYRTRCREGVHDGDL